MSLLDEIKKLIMTVENSKEEETQEDEKKVENENDKEEKAKVENSDDKEPEKKEEAENKCDKKEVNNAKEDFYEKVKAVYNSALKAQEEKVYVSRAEKLEAANEYFKV